MKFGQYLESHKFPPWQNEYVQYNQLKYFLKDTQLSKGWTSEDERYFIETLVAREYNKVQHFIQLKINQIHALIQNQDRDILRKVDDLVHFIQLNSVGFQKILKKHDKWTGISQEQRYHTMYQQLNVYIDQLNQMKQPFSQTWITKKYWIHPDNLTEVEAILLFHLPTITGGNKIVQSIYFDNLDNFHLYTDLLERKDPADIVRARWYGLTTDQITVHIEKKTYHTSWLTDQQKYSKEGIQLPLPTVHSFLTQGEYHGPQPHVAKTLHTKLKPLRSTLRCFHYRKTYQDNQPFHITLDTKVTFMKEMGPTWKRNDIGDSYPFDHLRRDEVYFFPFSILETKCLTDQPLPDWLQHLVSSQLVYEVPYFSKYLHGTSHFFWERLPMLPWWSKEMTKDIRKMPSYAVLQQQQQQYDEHDEKIIHTSSCTVVDASQINLINSHYEKEDEAYESPFASKFKQLKENYFADPNQQPNHIGMGQWLCAKITRNKAVLEKREQDISFKKGKKKKVEPKIFFANERTFISWLQFSALLFTVSLGLVNFGDSVSKGSGAFFIIVAMILAFYAQLRFQYRTWQIKFRNTHRFDDRIGPAILCFVLVVALFVNLALRLQQPLPETPSPFGYNATASDSTSVIRNNTRIDKHGRIVPIEEEDEA